MKNHFRILLLKFTFFFSFLIIIKAFKQNTLVKLPFKGLNQNKNKNKNLL